MLPLARQLQSPTASTSDIPAHSRSQTAANSDSGPAEQLYIRDSQDRFCPIQPTLAGAEILIPTLFNILPRSIKFFAPTRPFWASCSMMLAMLLMRSLLPLRLRSSVTQHKP
jgi:hypothetical protein